MLQSPHHPRSPPLDSRILGTRREKRAERQRFGFLSLQLESHFKHLSATAELSLAWKNKGSSLFNPPPQGARSLRTCQVSQNLWHNYSDQPHPLALLLPCQGPFVPKTRQAARKPRSRRRENQGARDWGKARIMPRLPTLLLPSRRQTMPAYLQRWRDGCWWCRSKDGL